jgi:hypothetical protein
VTLNKKRAFSHPDLEPTDGVLCRLRPKQLDEPLSHAILRHTKGKEPQQRIDKASVPPASDLGTDRGSETAESSGIIIQSISGPLFLRVLHCIDLTDPRPSALPRGYRIMKKATSRFPWPVLMLLLCLCVAPGDPARGEDQNRPSAPENDTGPKPHLTVATMCERVDNLTPTRAGITFSVSAGQVCCYSSFDPVPQPTLIYHRWYHRDELSTQTRLRIYPPKWSTYSVIQLRETDKGPWRVEISDQNGRVFSTLRFSITD